MEIRELIFRGFHPCDGPETIVVDGEKVKGRWVEGDFLTDSNGDTYITACKFTPMMPGFEKQTTLPIKCNHPEKMVLSVDVPVFEVIPSTVGQYTGLTDKNGKKVFVGDIVRCSRGCPHKVVWVQEHGGTYFGGMPAVYLSGLRPGYAWTGAEEVIGTVFDEEAHNAQN